MASEDIFFVGKFDDPNDPRQLEELWAWMMRIQGRINQFDPASIPTSWMEGYAAGNIIRSDGVGNPPVWDDEFPITGITVSGLTASQMVVTDASKKLASSSKQGVTNGDSHDHAGGDGAQVNHAGLANLTTGDPHTQYQLESEKDGASGYAGLNASSRTTKGVDTSDDLIVDVATKGLVLKDTAGTPHYWRVTADGVGGLTITDLGTSKP